MKILFVTMQFGRSYTQGTERYVTTLATALRRRGHEVAILAGDPLGLDRSRRLGECVDEKQQLFAYPTRGWMAVEGLSPRRLAPFLRQWRPDVVHLNTPAHIGAGMARAARQLNIPLIITAHDFWWICPKGTLLRGDGTLCDGKPDWRECLRCIGTGHSRRWVRGLAGLRWLPASALLAMHYVEAARHGMSPKDMWRWPGRRAFLREVLHEADGVICPSRTMHELLSGSRRQHGWRIIRNGIAAEWFANPRAVSTHVKSPSELTIGYAGALAPHKGPHLLLEAVRLLGWKQTRIRIAGPVNEPTYATRLHQAAAGLNVEFPGNLPAGIMRDFLRSLDVLAVTSLWLENCPYVVLEAQAAGVAVVGPERGGVAELIADAGLRYPLGSVEGLAGALEYARTHPAGSKPSGVPTEEQMVEATEELYRLVCASKGSCGPREEDEACSNGDAGSCLSAASQPRNAESTAERQGWVAAIKRWSWPVRLRMLAGQREIRSWLRRHGVPWPVSRPARGFLRYKRARSKLCPAKLSALRVPGVEGLTSIVLPVYNGAAYLREAIESVLAQTRAEFELIVVDDGSTDDTPDILAEYASRDRRIRVIRQTNQKLPAALNAGFRAAAGEFLTWTSADNRLRPEFLECMVGCLLRHPDWDMIYANEDIIDERGRPLLKSPHYPLYQRPLGSNHLHFPATTCELNVRPDNIVGGAFLYRSRVRFLIGDYSPWWFGLEDYDYWMRVNAMLRLEHADFDHPVYEYRYHEDSLTSRQGGLASRENVAWLLAADTARRESFVKPLAWQICADPRDELSNRLADRLKRAILDAGQVELASTALAEKTQPGPAVHVRIASSLAEHPTLPEELPAGCCKVLVLTSEAPLPTRVPEGWDLYAAWSSSASPQRLASDRCGWLVTCDLEGLFAAIDIRTRCDRARRSEAGWSKDVG